jgi:CO/xanthine dehydrogenase FAD-binding subunit
MIEEYHRPKSLDEALELLAKSGVRTIPIGGGSGFDRFSHEPVRVVDLQGLGLDTFRDRGKTLDLGATLTLQALINHQDLQLDLHKAIRYEASYNLRQVATVAGSLVAAGGRSPFATVMLALDASITIQPGEEQVSLGSLMPVRAEQLKRKLISLITIPKNVRLAYEASSRTPADLPIVCVAVAMWPSGRTRVALGGWGATPLVAMDGPEAGGLESAVCDAYSQAGDEWASAEYRQVVAGVLVERCRERIE